MDRLSNEQIINVFSRYCGVDCCGRIQHTSVHPEHSTILPIPEHEDYYLVNKEESQILVHGKPEILRTGDVDRWPLIDFSSCERVAVWHFSNIGGWNVDFCYNVFSIQDQKVISKLDKHYNYDQKENLPKRWGYDPGWGHVKTNYD